MDENYTKNPNITQKNLKLNSPNFHSTKKALSAQATTEAAQRARVHPG
jgi:hypothetical protein